MDLGNSYMKLKYPNLLKLWRYIKENLYLLNGGGQRDVKTKLSVPKAQLIVPDLLQAATGKLVSMSM
jgi:hypothetical protein